METKKVCYVYRQDNNLILHPILYDSLTDNCITKKTHKSDYYPANQIFDLRRELIQNCINPPLYFYCVFFNSNREPMNFTEDQIINTTTYEFIRKKKNKFLKYNPKINIINTPEKIGYWLHIGSGYTCGFRDVAYEVPACCSNMMIFEGSGFYGFKINANKDFNPKYAALIICSRPYHNDELDKIYPKKDLCKELGINKIPEPSAPPSIPTKRPPPYAPHKDTSKINPLYLNDITISIQPKPSAPPI